MDLVELSAMYDPETMDFDEFVQQYNKPKHLRDEQDFAYEQSLAQDIRKQQEKKEKEQQEKQEKEQQEREQQEKEEPAEDPKPTLAELRQLRIAKLSIPPKIQVNHTVMELKKMCKERGIKGFTGKCKQELIAMLN